MSKLQNKIRPMRERLGISRSQLAEAVGVSRQLIFEIEKKQIAPNTAVALKLAAVLGATVEELFVPQEVQSQFEAAPLFGAAKAEGRVCFAQVGNRKFSIPLSQARAGVLDGFLGADAVRETGHYELWTPLDLIGKTALLLGCDPSL